MDKTPIGMNKPKSLSDMKVTNGLKRKVHMAKKVKKPCK
jgi:hypothetical protein